MEEINIECSEHRRQDEGSKFRVLTKEEVSDVNFSTLYGLTKQIQRIRSLLEDYKTFDILEKPKGLLFYGAPGTGKTSILKALIKETDYTIINVKMGELINSYYGASEKNIEQLFREASLIQNSIIFIDEIDGVTSARSADDDQQLRRILETLLTCIDGIQKTDTILIGCTNFPGNVEPALLDRLRNPIYFPLPDFEKRRQFLECVLQGKHNMTASELNLVSRKTEGFSYRSLQKLIDEAYDVLVQFTKEADHFKLKHSEKVTKYEPCFCSNSEACPGVKMNYTDKMPFLIEIPHISFKTMSTLLNSFGCPENEDLLQGIEKFKEQNGDGLVDLKKIHHEQKEEVGKSSQKRKRFCICKCKKVLFVTLCFSITLAVLVFFGYLIVKRLKYEVFSERK